MLATLTAAASGSSLPEFLTAHDWVGTALQLLALMSPIVMGLLALLARAGAQLIAAKTSSEKVRDILLRLDSLAYRVVAELEQTTVAAIRERSADGKLTDAEKAEIQDAAMAKLLSYLGPKGLEEVKGVLGIGPSLLDGFLSTALEAALGLLKASQPKLLRGVTVSALPADAFEALPPGSFTRKPAFGPPTD